MNVFMEIFHLGIIIALILGRKQNPNTSRKKKRLHRILEDKEIEREVERKWR